MTKAKDTLTGQFISQREQNLIQQIQVLEDEVKDWEMRYKAGEKYAKEKQMELQIGNDTYRTALQEKRVECNNLHLENRTLQNHYMNFIEKLHKRNKNNTWFGVGIGILITVVLEILKYNFYAK